MTPQDYELIHDYLHDRLTPERGPDLAALLDRSAEARAMLRAEAAIETRLRELATSETLAPAEARAGGNRSAGWLAPVAAGIALGVMFATATWASVAAFRREPPPVPLPLANGGFETLGAIKLGGYPKAVGLWRGDAAECVAATAGVRPHSGAGMLRFLHPDGRSSSSARGFTACDQWQLLAVPPTHPLDGDGEQSLAEAEVWFNGLPGAQAQGRSFQLTLYAVEVRSLSDLNRISSVWLRQSSAVLATVTRRIVSDGDPATWERVAVSLPLPPATKYLLVQLSAGSHAELAGASAFPGLFADSASVQLRKVAREHELLTAQ
jgi:hypothetical protein